MMSKKFFVISLILFGLIINGISFVVHSEPITVSDSLVKSDFLITKESDYRSFGFFNVVDPVVYSDNVLCEGNIPLIVSFDKVVDNKNFLGSYEQSKNSFSAVNYVYEILVNETYSYQMPVYKTVKDVSKNGTVTEYTVIDYYLNKTSYRWVWKNLNGLSSLSIVKDKVVVINIKGYFKAGLGFRCIDVVPSITIGNERQNLVKYAWWNTNYTYNLPVWVDYSKITTDLVNFPVAFFIDDATADKMNGGKSFRPVSGDNTTVYDYMIDTWVDGADRIVYVKVPRIESDSYTLVNLYYGNASATDLSNRGNTYSNSIYTDVYNCSETSGNLLGLKDVYDFATSGSPTYSQVGQVGKCVYIDADSDYFLVNTNFSIFDTGGWSMWSKVTYDVDLYCHEGLVSIPNTASGSGIQGAQVMPNGSYYVRNYNTGGSGSAVYGDSINLSDGVFHHLGFFYDKTAGYNYVYIDGVLLGQAVQSGNLKSALKYTYIGAFSSSYKTGSNSVHAYVDELHFFPTVVNASWFKAEYNSGADTLLIWGTERGQVPPNTVPVISGEHPTDKSINQPLDLTWNCTITDADGESFNWSIDCSNGQSISMSGASNGSKSLPLTGLDYYTNYTVWVNVTDGIGWTKEKFWFWTQSECPEYLNYSTNYSIWFCVNVSDDIDDIDFLNVSLFNSSQYKTWSVVHNGTFCVLFNNLTVGVDYIVNISVFDGSCWVNSSETIKIGAGGATDLNILLSGLSIENSQLFLFILLTLWIYFLKEYLDKRNSPNGSMLAKIQLALAFPLTIQIAIISFSFVFGYILVFIIPVLAIYIFLDSTIYMKNNKK